MMRRFKEAARQGRVENALRKALAEKGLAAEITIRALEGRISAAVVLKEGLGAQDPAALEAELLGASGADRLTLVTTAHENAGSSGRPAPLKPAPARGGHADPLGLGAKVQARPSPQRPNGVRAVIAVASGKGGVGKSTVAASLALRLSEQGLRVGILDLDIHGPSLPVLFPREEKLRGEEGRVIPAEAEGLKLVSLGYMVDERQAVAWRGPMVMNAARQLIDETDWGELDILIVDTPPGTGDAHLSMIQRLKLDGAVLVATPSPLALADVRRGASLFEKAGTPLLGVVVNMTGGPMGDDLPPGLAEELGLDVLDRTPLSPGVASLPFRKESGATLEGTTQAVTALFAQLKGDSGARSD
ncbi:P-loop NTPase [Parvularcula maris]|uniref:Iron-sulfur cluster carrier protein n=1 Tax=Parvularcula maris TaxID=2965077 RepID=A0A9X2L9L4_9PROT|nr:P-loop NTPase [Parvularcula maris]MCQ8184687.1 Mrp/NBP35 family ATP-binding protein [Parvularcula maris]